MPQNYEDLFKNLDEIEPATGLYQAILNRIDREKRRLARIRLGFFGAATLASVGALVPALQYLAAGFHATGFYQYLSLIFTDSGLLLAYWETFALSLLDSLPLLGIIVFLSALLALLAFLRLAAREFKTAFSANHLI